MVTNMVPKLPYEKIGEIIVPCVMLVYYGNLDDMDSFRAELYGILSALVVLDILVWMEGVRGTVKKIPLWTDIQASITAIKIHCRINRGPIGPPLRKNTH